MIAKIVKVTSILLVRMQLSVQGLDGILAKAEVSRQIGQRLLPWSHECFMDADSAGWAEGMGEELAVVEAIQATVEREVESKN